MSFFETRLSGVDNDIGRHIYSYNRVRAAECWFSTYRRHCTFGFPLVCSLHRAPPSDGLKMLSTEEVRHAAAHLAPELAGPEDQYEA